MRERPSITWRMSIGDLFDLPGESNEDRQNVLDAQTQVTQ